MRACVRACVCVCVCAVSLCICIYIIIGAYRSVFMNTCVCMYVDYAWAYIPMHTCRCKGMGKFVLWVRQSCQYVCTHILHLLVYVLCVVCFVGCLSSQQHASVSQGRICTDNFTCCHTEIEAADQTFHLTQSQYTDTGPTSPSADPITPGAWQGSHWSANF